MSTTSSIMTKRDLEAIVEEIHTVSNKVATDVFQERKTLILEEIQKQTGIDLSDRVSNKKGRPKSSKTA